MTDDRSVAPHEPAELLAALPEDVATAVMEIMRTLVAYRETAHAIVKVDDAAPDELRAALRRALDEHMAEKRAEVRLTGEPAEGGAGCWCHDARSLLNRLDAAALRPAGAPEPGE